MKRMGHTEFLEWKRNLQKNNPNKLKPRRPQRNLELQLQASIIIYLKMLGLVVGKTKTMGVMRQENGKQFYCYDSNVMIGKPDLECFSKDNQIMYCIEVKSPTGKQSEAQVEYQRIFHKPPNRIYILAKRLEDVTSVIK